MRIALDERFRDMAARHLSGREVAFYRSGATGGSFATPDEFLAQVGDATVIGCGAAAPWPFDSRMLDALPHLRFIHKIGTGTNWFDLEALSRRGVLLANNAGLNAASVADHLVMLMLLCLRSALEPIVNLRRGVWDHIPPERIIEVEDVAIGIVGFGQIGQAFARRLHGFGNVRIAMHRRRPIDAGLDLSDVRRVPLDELLRTSDVAVLCVPLTPATRGLIGAPELALMKEGAVLVNASRGGVVDEIALCEALQTGHLSAAASDVFAEEPAHRDHPLLSLQNFIGTPHMAGRSRRNSPRQLQEALRNINRFLAGERPLRLVNG